MTQLKAAPGLPLRQKFQDFFAAFNLSPRVLAFQRKQISAFLKEIKTLSLESQVFDDDVENMDEGWEKLVMSQVYERVFTNGSDEVKANSLVSKKIDSYKFICERHLDIAINFSLSLEIASAELLRINGYKSPRDKLVIMCNVLQLITGSTCFTLDIIAKCGKGEVANQDTILPSLILVIIRANPANMISNIKYVTRFRNPQDLEDGKIQFVMTSMMGAVSFIYNMDLTSLTLDDEEKERMYF